MRVFGLLALILSGNANAADTVLYGKVQLHYADEQAQGTPNRTKRQAVGDNGTFLGIKGFHPLDHSVDVTYKGELNVHFNKSDNNLNNNFSAKQYWVGLRGDAGELRVGKHPMPNKTLTSATNVFSDQLGDSIGLIEHEVDASDSVMYIQRLGHADIALGYGKDKNQANKPHVKGAVVSYKRNGWFGMAGWQQQAESYTDSRLALGYQTPTHQVAILHQATNNHQLADTKTTMISASHQQGNWILKGQAGRKTDYTPNPTKLVAIGADFKVAKGTTVYLEHSISKDQDGSARLAGGSKLTGDKVQATAIGLKYEF